MRTPQRVFKNSVFLLVGRMISLFLSMVFSVYAARKMGQFNFGSFSFVISLVSYFLIFSGAELQGLLVRDIASQKHRSAEYLSTAIVFKFIISVVSIILLIFLTKFIARPEIIIPLAVAAFSLIPSSLYDAFDAVFRGHEKMEYIAFSIIAYSVLKTGVGIFLISLGVSLSALFIGLLITEIFKATLIYLFYHRYIGHFEWKFSRQILRYLFRESYILILITGGLGLFYYRSDIMYLTALVGVNAVGQFSASVNLSGFFTTVSAVVISALLPVISQYYQENRVKMLETLRISLKYILGIFILLIAFCTLFSDRIILFFYGREYLPSSVVLMIVIWSALFSTLLGLQGVVLLVSNQYRRMAKIYTLVVIMKLALSYYLIKTHALLGAAVSYALSDVLALLCYYSYARKEIKGLSFSKELSKILIALAAFVITFTLARPIGKIGSFSLACALYLYALFLLGIFNFRELRSLGIGRNLRSAVM